MTKKAKAQEYLSLLDRILAGEKEAEFGADREVTTLLRLARTIMDTDLSFNSDLREAIRKQVLEQAAPEGGPVEEELTEEELDYAAAGLAGPEKNI
ncbi:hypothetical protein Desor_3726 [Desulfosporosinus orientis DSM 765]|uniref:Uncharacterized protein n=1 Tax=Desulfosporosinus orientis (strain ATCC 19365 / DSM 765 / NCIMB 8382 / VKM B-1628 / Singapore I) TaxID=768706 RepID=G7W6R0_DESOD|nr:hypothetical protein [Desulfosporosinus orientis]AET69192.1 hypothetical protein Desor_3726 [Desulfosporosinus orientis DSM 765]